MLAAIYLILEKCSAYRQLTGIISPCILSSAEKRWEMANQGGISTIRLEDTATE